MKEEIILKTKPFDSFVAGAYPDGSITQFFGENPKLYSTVCHSGICMTGGHNGLDIVAPWGTPLYPVEDGTVVEVKDSPNGYGKHIRILNKERTREWTYGHLSEILCYTGQEITTKDCLGNMGNTGFVVSGATPFWKANPYAGTHLHLGLRLFKEYKGRGTYNIQYFNTIRGTILNYENGFFGSVNFGFSKAVLNEEEKTTQLMLTVISLANQAIELYKKLLWKK